ncbi:hypothetical protein SAFG77S_08170 [Streptomyces afghaniensis]
MRLHIRVSAGVRPASCAPSPLRHTRAEPARRRWIRRAPYGVAASRSAARIGVSGAAPARRRRQAGRSAVPPSRRRAGVIHTLSQVSKGASRASRVLSRSQPSIVGRGHRCTQPPSTARVFSASAAASALFRLLDQRPGIALEVRRQRVRPVATLVGRTRPGGTPPAIAGPDLSRRPARRPALARSVSCAAAPPRGPAQWCRG